MISCKDVSALLMSDQLQAQTWWKRAEVRLHLAMCRLCSRLKRQLDQMHTAALALRKSRDAPDAELEELLLRRLSEK